MNRENAHLLAIHYALILLVVLAKSISAFPTQVREEMVVEAGGNISLRCDTNSDINGDKLDYVSWYMEFLDGTEKFVAIQRSNCTIDGCKHNSSSDRFNVELDIEKKTATLKITNVQHSDMGNYACFFVTKSGIEKDVAALRIKPPADVTCSGCKIDSPTSLTIMADMRFELTCSTGEEFKADVSLGYDDRLNVQKINTSISFIPTPGDDGRWITCLVRTNEHRNLRNFTLHVLEQTTTNETSTTLSSVIKPDTIEYSTQRICFYAGVFVEEEFLQSSTCYANRDVLYLPNDMHNDVGILVCTEDDCLGPIRVKTADNNQFTMATYLSISLYVIIAVAVIFIIIAIIWRKRKVGVRVEVTYEEPFVSKKHPARKHPAGRSSPHLDTDISSPSTSATFTSAYYPSSCYDDDLEELESSWSENPSNGKKPSLRRTISACARKSLRDSTVIYSNMVPITSVLDRVKTVGWSYF